MNQTYKLVSGIFLGLLLLLAACSDKTEIVDPPPAYTPTPYELEIPYAFPTKLNIPEDNPLTVEGVELGRYLFYDGRLSGRTHPDSLMSCATCHIQENNFEPGVDHPVFEGGFVHGLSGQQTHHVVLSLVNLVWNSSGYGWSGSFYNNNENPNQRQIEDIVSLSVMAPDEMFGDTSRVKALFQSLDGYPELFYKAFGSDQITFKNIARAIAQFVRTFVSADAKIDRYLRGEEQLTQSELNGFILFTTEEGADCFHCHGGFGNPLFTTHLFYNNGKDTVFNDPLDRFAVTGDPMHKGAYKAPTLRNISLSSPYMHDGRFATLDEVIDFYSHQVKWSDQIDPLMHHVLRGGVQLTPSEKADLIAFIATLHDENFLTNPAYSKPDKFPDEN
ncbi:MAG: cytochrome c peroxidase [Bacteroidales bacterium]|nr:cytochrome c peroxidase [Bacteroidales bacterium]HOI31392.1 cytochrome c peroxidase [Bacteroidales bacterium]